MRCLSLLVLLQLAASQLRPEVRAANEADGSIEIRYCMS